MPRLASILIVLFAATAADAKPKGKQSVKAHMERAAQAHKSGKFDVALGELQAAYAIDPQPKLLYAIAQVHAKLDNCAAAIEYYEKYLETESNRQKQAVVRQAIGACKEKLDTASTEPPPVEPAAIETSPVDAEEPPPVEDTPPAVEDAPPAAVATAPSPAVTATATASTRSAWYRDPFGGALVLAGAGAGAASYLMYRGANSDLDQADAAEMLAQYENYVDSAHQKRTYAVILAGGGLVLVAAGVVRYALRGDRRESSGVAVVPAAGGGLVTWSGGF